MASSCKPIPDHNHLFTAHDGAECIDSLLVKRILRKYKYPPDQQEEAAQLVLAQAETLCEAWM